MGSKELFKKAQRLFVEGKTKESIGAFTEAIDSGEKNEIAYLSRGVAYLNSSQKDKAIEDFSDAVNLNDNNTRAHYYRGIAYMTKDEYKKAIADFDRTIELRPDDGAAFFARGTAYAQIGRKAEATKNIRTALAVSETDIEGVADTIELWRTQLEKAVMILTEREKAPSLTLTDEEINTVRNWLDERMHH